MTLARHQPAVNSDPALVSGTPAEGGAVLVADLVDQLAASGTPISCNSLIFWDRPDGYGSPDCLYDRLQEELARRGWSYNIRTDNWEPPSRSQS